MSDEIKYRSDQAASLSTYTPLDQLIKELQEIKTRTTAEGWKPGSLYLEAWEEYGSISIGINGQRPETEREGSRRRESERVQADNLARTEAELYEAAQEEVRGERMTTKKALQVYGYRSVRLLCPPAANGNRQTREIVAVTSRAAAVRAYQASGLRCSYKEVADYGCWTKNAIEVAVATAMPGRVFWAPLDGHKKFTLAPIKEVK